MRRLSAILAADVVGYSALMAENEAGTMAALRAHRAEVFDPETERHGGRIVKLMGDGALVEFPSVVDAVECALAVQSALAEQGGPIKLRIGINLGDVILEGDDIYGDGVNVAARLEGLAAPGGICVSSVVHESIGNRVEAEFTNAGAHEVKGMPRPIRVWRWPAESTPHQASEPLALPEKPSIAILPFENMSADPDQEFFADGIAEDIITELSKFRSLFVIARNSSFAFKGQALDVREIGKRLGVHYVVEGSVRRAGNRVRVTAQLIDAADDTHLWAERYDRGLEDIFAVQDEVTQAIVTTIEPHLADTERQRARRKPPDSLGAWENYQRGQWHMYQYTSDGISQAMEFQERASEIDADFAPAYAGLAFALYYHVLLGFSDDRERDLDRAEEVGRRAVSLDASDPFAHVALGRTYTIRGDHDTAIRHCDRAISLNPSFSGAHFGRAHSLWMSGDAEAAIASNSESIRLSPHDPMLWGFLASRSIAMTLLGRYEEGLDWASRALGQPNAALFASVAELAALGLLDRAGEAAIALERARRFKPDVTTGFVNLVLPITDPDYHALFMSGLRKAGMPD
ncbi:MAG: tetratricopeptide repeat protein [Paracoccaceae bacterium]|nr:tetratricopeptide repeat protein [Paracoccaceae bacterium]